jgi:hypothetical protein
MATDEALEKRGLYRKPYPKSVSGATTYPFNPVRQMPIPFNMASTPTRMLKKEYKGKEITLNMADSKGYRFQVRFEGAGGGSLLYMNVVLGEPLQFCYEIEGECFTFSQKTVVAFITIREKGISVFGTYDDDSQKEFEMIFTKSGDIDDGMSVKVEVGSVAEYTGMPDGTPLDTAKETMMRLFNQFATSNPICMFNFNTKDEKLQFLEGNIPAKNFQENLIRVTDKAKIYYSADSFLLAESVDKYLLQEKVDFKDEDSIDISKYYLEVILEIEGAGNATDNFTGNVEKGDKLIEKIIMPQEINRSGLQPLVTMGDGEAYCEGRMNDFRFKDNVALFSYSDSTELTVPHPEDKTFKAKDTQTGQELVGKVISMELKEGNGAEAVRERKSFREKNNTNTTLGFDVGEKENVLDSIGWITGMKNDFIKLLIPSGDKTKIVTINVGDF